MPSPATSGQREIVAGESAELYRSLRKYTISGRQLFWTFRVEVEEDWTFSLATNRAAMPSFNPVVSFFAMTGSAALFKEKKKREVGRLSFSAMLPLRRR